LVEQAPSIDRYAVVGNPIAHSLSPRIHRMFAEQTQQSMSYEAIELSLNDFPAQVLELQQQGWRGLNVTVPFKQQAWGICQQRSQAAEQAGAVNTLVFTEDGTISGENTDGSGLIRDLINNHHTLIEHRKILILGAGGATRGVLTPLLALEPAKITIANRTLEKAEKLVNDFLPMGNINACGFKDLEHQKFDLIINATAAGLSGEVPQIPHAILGINSICYDMMYDISKPTAFLAWAYEGGAASAVDGLGMLVEQAAESFFIWRGIRVETARLIAELRQY